MSPASVGNLEVERYIGACLISRSNSKNGSSRGNRTKDPAAPDRYNQQTVNHKLQRCQSAGGMPLFSFTNHPRRTNDFYRFDEINNPLARLAVHTQGAPLILSRSYNHRKNNGHRNNSSYVDNIQHPNKCQQDQRSNAVGVDAVSVTSDESSCSNNSETCLPRIIKPRKRRKKDRKPPVPSRPIFIEEVSKEDDDPDLNNTHLNVSFEPYLPFNYKTYAACELPRSVERGDISETPKLHHSFEDIEEPNDDGKDINGNESTCQCRYCDPSGQIWDVDRNCYSPFLTPPNNNNNRFDFSNRSSPFMNTHCIEHSLSAMTLDEKSKPSSLPSLSCTDLEVSTEIVTSLNGHRDLEIRFFTMSNGGASSQCCRDEVILELDKCTIGSENCEFR